MSCLPVRYVLLAMGGRDKRALLRDNNYQEIHKLVQEFSEDVALNKFALLLARTCWAL